MDESTGGTPTSWSWDFGDGGTSSAQNPQYTYTAAGTYTVSLTVSNGGSDMMEKTAYITVSAPPAPVSEFSGTPTSGEAPLTVNFMDESTGGTPTSWSWDFGDNSETSTLPNPSHTYTEEGTYTVTLTATNAGGSDGETKVDYVTVDPAAGPTKMRVDDIVVTKQNLGRGDKEGVAVVTIRDDLGNLVAGATVTGDFSGKTNETVVSSDVTDGFGQVTLRSSVARGGGEWCFEVTDVTNGGVLNYVSGDNLVTHSCESGDVF